MRARRAITHAGWARGTILPRGWRFVVGWLLAALAGGLGPVRANDVLLQMTSEAGAERAAVSSAGGLFLHGSLTQGAFTAPAGKTGWLIEDSSGTHLAWIQLDGPNRGDSTGDMKIKGTKYEGGSPAPNTSHLFSITDGTGAILSINSSGNLYLDESLHDSEFGAVPGGFSPTVPGLGNSAKVNARSLVQYAAQYASGDTINTNYIEIASYGDYDSTQQKFVGWIGERACLNPVLQESQLVLRLVFAYHLLKDTYWSAQADKDDFFDLLDHRAYTILYTGQWGSSKRRYSNRYIRMIAGIVTAGLVLQYSGQEDEREHAEEMVEEGLEKLKMAFVNIEQASNNYKRSFADEESGGAVGYNEGVGYAEFASNVLSGLIYFLDLYPIPSGCAAATASDKATVQAKHKAHVRWVLETQRVDGAWFPQNDSGPIDNYLNLSVFYNVYKDDPEMQAQLRWVYTQIPATPTVPVADCNLKCIAFNQPWLNRLLFGMLDYQGSSLASLDARRWLYPKAGQLFLGTTRGSDSQSVATGKAIVGAFYNEGCWHYADFTIPSWNVYKPYDNLYREFCEKFVRPSEKLDSTSYYTPKQAETHKRINDTHFEIFAYGKTLLIGPGQMTYHRYKTYPVWPANGNDEDNNDYSYTQRNYPDPNNSQYDTTVYAYWPYNYWNHTDQCNLTQVGADSSSAYYPKTEVLERGETTMKVKTTLIGSSSGGDAYLYKMESDCLLRYVLWAHERYFIVFDRVNPSFSESAQYMKLRLNGRGLLTAADHTGETGHRIYKWQYGERQGNYPVGYPPTYNDTDFVTRDTNLELLVYAGNPKTISSVSYTVESTDHDGRDTGEDGRLEIVPAPEDHNWYKHDVLGLATASGKNQYGMVNLFWPRNKSLTSGTFRKPTINWTVSLSGSTITVIAVTVAYTYEGLSISDSWTFPVNGSVVDAFSDIES